MKRREFITLLGGAAAWPLAARAQQPAMPVIGLLSTRAPDEDPRLLAAIHQGLKEMGYVEGRNVAIEPRFAANQYDRLPGMAAELVRHQVAVLTTMGTAAAPAAKAATSIIPVIFGMGDDPVKLGLVTSLNRPGGNLTGIALLSEELGPKRLELLHELVPAATDVAVLLNPASTAMEIISKSLQVAGRSVGLQLHFLNASTDGEIEKAFTTLIQGRLRVLLVVNDAFFNSRAQRITALAARNGVPGMYPYRDYAVVGGLMSYGASLTFVYQQVGIYTGRILKGEKPGDLPVIQASKFDFVINLKTAKALGIEVPPPLLARADEVIE
jgi:putative ABC transport system substrate-binding protein